MKKTICVYLTLVLILAGCGNLKRQITGTVKPADQLIPSDNPPESGKDKKIVGDIKGVGGDKQDNVYINHRALIHQQEAQQFYLRRLAIIFLQRIQNIQAQINQANINLL